jgi:protein-S-isoprenylcysteine O-methyltransferase Ste14
MRPNVGLALVCVGFFLVGIIALGFPNTIQRYGLELYAKTPLLARWNPFLSWMRSPGYVISLRLIGVLSLAWACLIAARILSR